MGGLRATGLAATLDGEVSHDQVSRFLRADDYGSKNLWGYIKPEIRRHEQLTGGVLLLDDTISEKAYTDENAVNCWTRLLTLGPIEVACNTPMGYDYRHERNDLTNGGRNPGIYQPG